MRQTDWGGKLDFVKDTGQGRVDRPNIVFCKLPTEVETDTEQGKAASFLTSFLSERP